MQNIRKTLEIKSKKPIVYKWTADGMPPVSPGLKLRLRVTLVFYDRDMTDISVGWPGSVHDCRIFKNSNLGKDLADGSHRLPDCQTAASCWAILLSNLNPGS